jgi:hypothetical protein
MSSGNMPSPSRMVCHASPYCPSAILPASDTVVELAEIRIHFPALLQYLNGVRVPFVATVQFGQE